MSDFNQDIENLLNAYDSNWEDYLILREQFIEKYKLSVDKLEPIGYYNEAHGFLHDESDKDCYCQGGCTMEAIYTESQVKELTGTTDDHWYGFITHQNRVIESDEKLVDKLQEQLNTAKKALTEIDCSRYDMQFRRDRNPNVARQALAAIGGDDE